MGLGTLIQTCLCQYLIKRPVADWGWQGLSFMRDNPTSRTFPSKPFQLLWKDQIDPLQKKSLSFLISARTNFQLSKLSLSLFKKSQSKWSRRKMNCRNHKRFIWAMMGIELSEKMNGGKQGCPMQLLLFQHLFLSREVVLQTTPVVFFKGSQTCP